MKAALVLAALVLVASPLDAQGTKKRSNKGSGATSGKKSRVKGTVFEGDRGRGATPASPPGAASEAPREADIRLGDRVRGYVGGGASHRVSFPAVKGTRMTIVITPADRKLTLAARVLDPIGTHLLTPTAKASEPSVLRVDDFVCPRTGTYAIEVSFAAGQAGDYLIETSGEHPDRAEGDLVVAGRRPTRWTLPGLTDRRLTELKIRALEGDELDLRVQLADPDGVTLPLDADTWRSSDGKTILVTRVPLDRTGDYRLTIMDRGDARAKVRVTARFDDPGPTRRLHEL